MELIHRGAAVAPALKSAPRRALKVLIVDDNLDQIHTLSFLLQHDYGHQCDFAINGIVALDLAQRHKPDVVLLDIGLPDTTGTTILRNIRSMRGLEQTVVIAVTGMDMTREEALRQGFDDLLKKPVDVNLFNRLMSRFPRA